MQNPPSHIPFPQGGDSPLLGSQGGKRLASPGYQNNNTFYPDHRRLPSSHSLPSSETSFQGSRQSFPSGVLNASSPSYQGESLPSIRNLLHSIEHQEADSSANLMRRSPSAPNLPSSTHFATPSDPIPVHFHNGGSLPRAANTNIYMGGPNYVERQNIPTWDSNTVPLRSLSPQRRPPLAPSAFAHSQYSHHANSRSDGAIYRPTSAAGSRVHRGIFASVNQGDIHKKQKNLHSPSSSIPSITSEELNEISLPSLGAWKNKYQDNGPPASNLMKRNLQSRQELEDSSTSPSASRRRHTVGALEEPHGLHITQEQSQELARRSRKITADSTPRITAQQLHLRVYATRPESPTTPTAGNVTSRFQRANRWDSGNSISGMMASHPSHHRVYMQHMDQATGSMPSLSSSISGSSLSSDRVRVHSLEEDGDRKVLPTWSNATEAIYLDKTAVEHSLPVPRATVWHSRSSTLDSVDSSSSFASKESPYNRPLFPPRSSSLHNEEDDNSVAWTATPTRRARDMATPYAFAKEKTRQNSMRGVEVHRSNSMRAEPVSLYNRTSLISPVEANIRPRAQTMAYTDRAIVPLPSQTQGLYFQHTSPPAAMTLMSERSLSSHSLSSVASLPQRVSSMEINQDANRVRNAFERNVFSSSSSAIGASSPAPSFGLPGDNVKNAPSPADASFLAVSSTGHAGGSKYQCGWCGKRFSRPSSLKIHHHSHTGEKPYACTAPNCGRTFSVQSNLRRHQKCHSIQGNGQEANHEDGPLVGYPRIQDRTTVSQQDERSFSLVAQEATASSSLQYNKPLFPFQKVAMPLSYSSPTELAMNHSRQGQGMDSSSPKFAAGGSHSNSFTENRERATSSASSNAEEEEEEEDDNLDEDCMQDIREEVVDIAPRHRSALQGLLN